MARMMALPGPIVREKFDEFWRRSQVWQTKRRTNKKNRRKLHRARLYKRGKDWLACVRSTGQDLEWPN